MRGRTQMTQRGVYVSKGSGGWGQGLYIEPKGKKNKVVCITGGGIHPVARKIAELTGTEAIDGFKNSVPSSFIAYSYLSAIE